MKLLIILLTTLPSLVCVLAAVYLAVTKKEGWGWFITAALLLAPALWIKDGPPAKGGTERPAVERSA